MDEKKKKILSDVGKFVGRTLINASPYIATDVAYKKFFYHHTYSGNTSSFELDLFPELIADRVTFKSINNDLVGYFYHYKEYNPSKIVIFVHGYGNGHRRYLDIINYLASQGLYVFSYDATSFDESSGEGIYGFPQGIIDLENAINYVKSSKNYKDKDIILMGHSWGAYSIGCTLNLFPNISKAIMMSGFNKSTTIVRQHGLEWAGEKVDNTIEYIDEYEEFRFGGYPSLSVIDGIKNSNTEVFIVHSEDDKTVPIEIGLNLYKKELGDNKRIIYKKFKDRGHGTVYDSLEGKEYYKSIVKQYKKYTKENKNLSLEDKKHLFNVLVNKEKWVNLLNYQLMDSIVNFINE